MMREVQRRSPSDDERHRVLPALSPGMSSALSPPPASRSAQEPEPLRASWALHPAPATPLLAFTPGLTAEPSPPPDVEQILRQTSELIGAQSCREWRYLALPNPFDKSLTAHAAICRSGQRAGFIAVVVDHENCFVIPPRPVIRSVRRNLADFSDQNLADFPESATGSGFIPIPDGPVQVTFFKDHKDGELALSAIRCPTAGGTRNLDLGDRTLESLSSLFGDTPLNRVPALQQLVDGRWQSMTFDLCGNELPGLVRYHVDCQLLPLWAATKDGTIYPLVHDVNPFDQQTIRIQVAKIRPIPDHIPTNFAARRMRSRGLWLCLTNQNGALIDATVWECTTDVVEQDRWRYFDHDLEIRIRKAVQDQRVLSGRTLGLPQRKWFCFQNAIRAFAAVISNPKPFIEQPHDPRTMLVLCGFPGCGKSFFSKAILGLTQRFVRINQDELGSRNACLRATLEALAAGSSVIIDRTNISIRHRAYFLELAWAECLSNVLVLLFDVPPQICAHRILNRSDHPTLAADSVSIDILLRFIQEFERPSVEEGFRQVLTVNSESESDDLALAIAALAESSIETSTTPSATSS